MENFAKSVLNYYATFNETRFNFSKKIPYEWTNNSLTLDLSLFPDFHQEMLGYISSGNPVCTEIAEGDYIIEIDEAKFRKQVIDSIGEQYHQEYLEDCIQRQQEKLAENGPTQTIAVNEDGTAQEPVSNSNADV